MPTSRESVRNFGAGLNQAIGQLLQAYLQNRSQTDFQEALRQSQTGMRAPTANLDLPVTGQAQMTGVPVPVSQPTDYGQLVQSTAGRPDLMPILAQFLQTQQMIAPRQQVMGLGEGGVASVSIPPFGGQPNISTLREPQDPLKRFTEQERIRTDENIRQARETFQFRPRSELLRTAKEGMQDIEYYGYVDTSGNEVITRRQPRTLPGTVPTAEMRNREAALGRIDPILSGIEELSEKINTGQGVMAKITGAVERAKAEANLNDDIAEYNALVSGFTPMVARGLGHTGVLTEQDVESVKKMFPQAEDSKSLRDRKVKRIRTILMGTPPEQLPLSGDQQGGIPQPIGGGRFEILEVK